MSTSSATSQVRDRSLPLLVAAGVLVVAVVGAVLVFGIARPPALSSLADDPSPAPDLAVAVTAFRDRPCIDVATADGRLREVRCDRDGGELVGWDASEGLLLVDWGRARPRLIVVDPERGDVVRFETDIDEERIRDPWQEESDGAVEHRDGDELVVVGPSGEELWRVAAPDAYQLRASSRSPDGRWVAAIDSAERLLLFDLEGAAPPRVWATGVDTYRSPVWQGDSGVTDRG